MNNSLLAIFFYTFCFSAVSQSGFLDFIELKESNTLPEDLTGARSAVIVNTPTKSVNGFQLIEDWQSIVTLGHSHVIQMGIDPILYVHERDLSDSYVREVYANLFRSRHIKYLVYMKYQSEKWMVSLFPFSGESKIVSEGSNVLNKTGNSLESTLIEVAKEIKRQELVFNNFLIPEKPFFSEGVSIAEKKVVKKFPGQLRRSLLAVEKFDSLEIPLEASEQLANKIREFNHKVRLANEKMEAILDKKYPFKYSLIDRMSHDDLMRNRYQFVLRHMTGIGSSVRELLEISESEEEGNYISEVPVMPDRVSIKLIPKNAVISKFYIRQNITKNLHVGKWDTDEDWEKALENFINHIIQNINKS